MGADRGENHSHDGNGAPRDDPPDGETAGGEVDPIEGESEEEAARREPDKTASGAPSEGGVIQDRFSTDEIFQRVLATGSEELHSSTRVLLLSGIAAGLAITLSFLAHAVLVAEFGGGDVGPAAHLLYPIGFVYIIVGRYQLYTEQTLTPVSLVLTRLASVPLLGKVWALVLAGNVVGAAVGAFVLANAGVLDPAAMEAGTAFAEEALKKGWWSLFYRGVVAGWIVASLVWVNHAVHDSVARVVVIYLAIYLIPTTGLYHIVVSVADAFFYLFEDGAEIVGVFSSFLLPVLLGNTLGGVFLVTLLNYGQTEEAFPEPMRTSERIGWREWLVGFRSTDPRAHEEDGP